MTDSSDSRFVVGLGNPGPKYEQTRHNIGAVALRRFLSDHDLVLRRARQGIAADVAEANLSGTRAVLAVPRTFMNESGQAVAPLRRYYGIDPAHTLVIHDDIDVPFGKLKVQWGGGHGGNNGVRSVAASLKTADFWRLKIGVGRPPNRVDPADYVLGKFRSSELEAIDVAVYRAADVAATFITDGGEHARQFAGELND